MKKLWVCDFDGTLYLPGDKRGFYKALEYLYSLREKGDEFIVASGRPLHLLEPFFERFSDTYFISCDGALFSKGFEIIKGFPLDKDKTNKIAEKNKSDYILTSAALSYVKCGGVADKKKFYEFYGGHAVSVDAFNEVDGEIYKVAFLGECVADNDLCRCWNSYGISEYVASGVSKGACLCYAKNVLGFAGAKVIAAGDGANDVSMFECADVSYAMNRAPYSVKCSASKIARDINAAFGEWADN